MLYVARRRVAEEPISKLAIWSRRLALFAIAVVLLVIVIANLGFLDPVPAIASLAGSLFFALVAMVLAFGAFVVIWRQGLRGLGLAVAALGIGVAMLAYPAYLGVRFYRLPAINDITTDPVDPPRFERLARLRPRGANPVAYPGADVMKLQRAAYPDIEPLLVSVPPAEAYEAAYAVIKKRRWRIVDERPPQTGRREGRIEAVAHTPIMGFRDDIVVRVRSAEDGARIDMRSASRYGRHDFGANASRLRSLSNDIDDAAGVEKAKPKPPPNPAPKKAPQRGKR
ncbi:MAG: DUF1499 domain-containing protein [Bradyrhizobiaceae bacterium]|nr:DUF1499 domain-containing protein [Hyphomicrobiales bacterium]MBV9428443.1 DUF1499 domain-containing protein [Bradyrhizobiaceae bacterium]